MEKYKPNWDTLRKTITILNEDNSIYAEFDYIDWLQFKVEYLQSPRLQKETFYIRNEHGGRAVIDKFACSYHNDFEIVSKLYHLIVKSQMKLRMAEYKNEQFNLYKNKIQKITSTLGNICNIGPNKICNFKTEWREPGVGCCHDCMHHSKEKGCLTENLICMSWYCDQIQKEISSDTLDELNKIITELKEKGLEVRQTKEEQINLI